ncbi:TPA: hypothetical protein PEP05_000797 [Vibrio parahaemolyticus]|nr:hypothetical protein [Vibrio parahaemolyticus]
MKKSFYVYDLSEVKKLERKIMLSIEKAGRQVAEVIETEGAGSLFYKIKFGGIGADPLSTDRDLNLIEQVNQSFTYLATLRSLEILFDSYGNYAPFKVNLGTTAGLDIESLGGLVAAEVFAAVSPNNNRKLAKDIEKVAGSNAKHKFVFMLCPEFKEGRLSDLDKRGVQVWGVRGIYPIL